MPSTEIISTYDGWFSLVSSVWAHIWAVCLFSSGFHRSLTSPLTGLNINMNRQVWRLKYSFIICQIPVWQKMAAGHLREVTYLGSKGILRVRRTNFAALVAVKYKAFTDCSVEDAQPLVGWASPSHWSVEDETRSTIGGSALNFAQHRSTIGRLSRG